MVSILSDKIIHLLFRRVFQQKRPKHREKTHIILCFNLYNVKTGIIDDVVNANNRNLWNLFFLSPIAINFKRSHITHDNQK